MADKIAWKQPKADAMQERLESGPVLKRVLRTWVIGWLVLGSASLYLVYRISPVDLKRTAIVIPVAAVLYTGVFALKMGAIHTLATFSISKRWGLYRASSSQGRRDAWKSIDGYRFADHPDLPGLRVLEFQAGRFKRWRRWAFDSEQVDESALRAMFEERLPGKCWDTTPSVI